MRGTRCPHQWMASSYPKFHVIKDSGKSDAEHLPLVFTAGVGTPRVAGCDDVLPHGDQAHIIA